MRIELKIREVRESKNISLSELARMAKISKGHLSCIERGEKEPKISTLVRIAVALKVDEKELYNIYY